MADMQPTWREERRRDRMADAQISRDNEAARAKARTAGSEARARAQRDERRARQAAKDAARAQRGERWAARAAWLRDHVTDLLFVPVIAVPGVLAWSAMAAYGHEVFGPAGFALPAFSEGAMWAFEARATWTARRHPGRPVWHLQAGSWGFAAVGAALNFLGGLTVLPHHPHGIVVGAVKAIVSAAGLTAHQIVNLGPRRSRAERRAARFRRAAERREEAVRRASLSGSAAAVDTDGNARVLFDPGTFTLTRRWNGTARLEAAEASPADAQAAEAVAAYRDWRSVFMTVPEEPPPAARMPRPAPVILALDGAAKRATVAPLGSAKPEAIAEPSRRAIAEQSGPSAAEPSAGPSPAKRATIAHVEKGQDAERARAAYRKSVRQGKPLTDRALGELFGKSRTWGASRIRDVETGPRLAAQERKTS